MLIELTPAADKAPGGQCYKRGRGSAARPTAETALNCNQTSAKLAPVVEVGPPHHIPQYTPRHDRRRGSPPCCARPRAPCAGVFARRGGGLGQPHVWRTGPACAR